MAESLANVVSKHPKALQWALQEMDEAKTITATAVLMIDLVQSLPDNEANLQLIARLVPDLFQFAYERGRNPIGDESDDISSWELLPENEWQAVAEVGKIEVVIRSYDEHVGLYLLGRTNHNTHPWLVKL